MFKTSRIITAAQVKNARKLKDLADKKRQSMEYGNVTIKKVKNLSRSDVEEIYESMTQLIDTEQDPYSNKISPSSDLMQVYINAGVFSE